MVTETNQGASFATQEDSQTGNGKLERSILGILIGATISVTGLVLDPILSVVLSDRGLRGDTAATFGYASLTSVIIGLCILFASASAILAKQSTNVITASTSSFTTLSGIFSENKYSRVLLLSAIVYAIFFALASGIIVYNPNVRFSIVYHASIPSTVLATCCSPLGQTPLAVVYLTEHLGLVLVPVNLFLLFSVSWLVGLNVATTIFALSLPNRGQGIGWLGSIGGVVGLFTSCPTCAGLAVLTLLGGTGALSTALFLGPLQLLFVALSIPVLVISPMVLARSIQGQDPKACVVP